MPRKHLAVYGRVQGVGFRYFAECEAERLDVAGWVRNRGDGSVEIEIQGDESVLVDFQRAIEDGPAFGTVSRVDVNDIAEIPGDDEFNVRF
jgi:acylphosphatase